MNVNNRLLAVSTVFLFATLANTFGETHRMVLFESSHGSDLSVWEIENDTVMGGRSQSSLTLSPSGAALFSGTVSLDNNGGFASIQYHFPTRKIDGFTVAKIRLRGDGKRYLFLVEAEARARHYYVGEFQTSGEWETVQIVLSDMIAVWRGDRLDQPNFAGETLAQVRVMIANQTRETFEIEISQVWLE